MDPFLGIITEEIKMKTWNIHFRLVLVLIFNPCRCSQMLNFLCILQLDSICNRLTSEIGLTLRKFCIPGPLGVSMIFITFLPITPFIDQDGSFFGLSYGNMAVADMGSWSWKFHYKVNMEVLFLFPFRSYYDTLLLSWAKLDFMTNFPKLYYFQPRQYRI